MELNTALYLDVDGVLNPWRALRPHRHMSDYQTRRVGDHKLWLSAEHGRLLRALDVRLVWATTWVASPDELEEIAQWVGLPRDLERIDWDPNAPGADDEGCGKLDGVRAHARDHGIERLVWVDDDLAGRDVEWMREEPSSRLMVAPRPHVGLRRDDISAVAFWLAGGRLPKSRRSGLAVLA